MDRPPTTPAARPFRSLLKPLARTACVAALAVAASCAKEKPPPPAPPRYPSMGLADVPPFMGYTIFERVQVTNTDPFPVGGYSLVVNLHNTGDAREGETNIPQFVRDYIQKQILVHQFGSPHFTEYAGADPNSILHDPRVAVVMVQGMLPVGALKGQQFDVTVRALPRSNVTSLSHGLVYQCDLSERGLQNPSAIGARPLARVAAAPVMVNPVYALTDGKAISNGALAPAQVRNSLRVGTALHAGQVMEDRPIILRIRQPELRMSRLIESVIHDHFQTRAVARAQDEALIEIYCPPQFGGDWKHFVGLVTHLYLNQSPAFTAAKAKELAVEARKPDAPLMDISYCWEGLGLEAVPFYADLLNDPKPEVVYAAARAAAFTGDPTARNVLVEIARDANNPFQLPAVQALGALPRSPEIARMLRGLLDADSAAVRIAAYKILADADDPAILSKPIGGDRFFLDVVDSKGPPLVYATRTGNPRIAVFGRTTRIQEPVTFMSPDTRLTISSSNDTSLLTIFYRDPNQKQPVSVLSGTDLAEVVERLGGEGPPGELRLDFTYGDVVAVVQSLYDQKRLIGSGRGKTEVAATFVLQSPELNDVLANVPSLTNDPGRPQGDGSATPTTAPSPNATPTALERSSSADPAPSGLGRVSP